MNRASVILRNAREDRSLETSEISKKLKIPKNYLDAIESEMISQFPSEPYCSLIIKDYATFLGLNGNDILSLFRRDFARPTNIQTEKNKQLSITPQSTFKFAVIASMIFFLGYIFTEYLKYNRPPELKVNWPDEKSLALNSTIDITGTTDPEATIRINNDLIIIDPNGSFHKSIILQNTDQKIIIESKSHSGKATVAEKIYHPK
jgi:hypothetical protein